MLAAVAVVIVACPTSGAAQASRASVDVFIGSFHHASDLHAYYATRFDGALAIGGGFSVPVGRRLVARAVLERVATHLTTGPALDDGDGNSDTILSAELQLAGTVNVSDRVQPYVGAGAGLRRYVVRSVILSDDIVFSPWARPQIQPAFSVLGGVGLTLTDRIGVAAEIRWSHARFRVAADSWGLPESPVAWQQEIRPGVRLAFSP